MRQTHLRLNLVLFSADGFCSFHFKRHLHDSPERKVTFSAFQVSSWTFTISIPPSSKLFVLVTSNNKQLFTLLLTKGTWTFCSATACCTRRNGTGEGAQAANSTQVYWLKKFNNHLVLLVQI